MYRPGHHGAAMLVYAPIGGLLLATGHGLLALVGGTIVIGGTMVPDYDRRSSLLQRRGPTHTVWFALLFGGLVGLGTGVTGWWISGSRTALWLFLFGFLGGTLAVLTHIACDALTHDGVRPFEPVRDDRYALGVTRATNPPTNYVLLAIGALSVSFSLLLGNAIGG